MQKKYLKKVLAGLSIAGLVAGVSISGTPTPAQGSG